MDTTRGDAASAPARNGSPSSRPSDSPAMTSRAPSRDEHAMPDVARGEASRTEPLGTGPSAYDEAVSAQTRDGTARAGAHSLRPRDWAWRRKIRSNPGSLQIYRWVVGTLGFVIVAGGLVMVPFPGPGWLVVFIGVSIWASEFHWARRLHRYGIGRVKGWNEWVMAQGLAVRSGLFVLTCLFVNAVVWTMLKLMGIPGWVPADVQALMRTYLAL